MPGMVRFDKKATKIAFNILGTPANLRKTKNKEEDKIDRRLVFEETIRVR